MAVEEFRDLTLSEEESEKAIAVPEFLKSEVNLLVLPFFALSRKEVKGWKRTEYRAVVEREGQKLEISWIVQSSSEYGYPGPFDRKVHRAIEEILSEMELPISNPIPFSIYDICKRIGINTGGKEYVQVKESLKRIKFTGIESRKSFYSKTEEQWIDDVFNLYDRIVFKGKRLPDGRIADTNYLFLNSWLLNNINALYIRLLDYAYYKSLKSIITQRLYELLGVKFYYIITEGLTCIHYRYSTLCQLLPLKRHYYGSYVARQLDGAHAELISSGFLAAAEREEIPEEKDWVISYYPGPRAKEEVERAKRRLGERELGFEAESPEQLPSSEALNEAFVRNLAKELVQILGDERSYPFYKKLATLCLERPRLEDLIYQVLSEVKDDWLQGRVRKSKGAHFTDKIKRYCRERGIDLGLRSKSR